MIVTHKKTMSLTNQSRCIDPVRAMQGDANTRKLQLILTANNEEWPVPEGTLVSVAFRNRTDGHKGWYDELPDGTDACSFNGNVVTVALAPAVLSSPGNVEVAVILQDAELNQLATFNVPVAVDPNPAAGAAISNDYYRYTSMEAVGEAVDAWLAETEAEKNDFLAKAEDALTTVREVVTTAEDAPAIVCEASGEVITVSDASDRLLHGLTIYGKTTQDGTPTPDNPVELVSVGDWGSIAVKLHRKNLLTSSRSFDDGVYEGVEYTKNVDGSINRSGTATSPAGNCWFTGLYGRTPNDDRSNVILILYKGITYTIRDCMLFYVDEAGKAVGIEPGTITPKTTLFITGVRNPQHIVGTTYNDILYPSVEIGSAATGYEMCSTQTLSLSTPNGLPGIPVPSGGNYTDANGQQWICDEVDLARGVYVQRAAKAGIDNWDLVKFPDASEWFDSEASDSYEITATSDGGYEFAEGKVGFCNVLTSYSYHTFYDKGIVEGIMNANPYLVVNLDKSRGIDTVDKFKAWCSEVGFEVLKPLATPIETPLSAEEIAAFAALRSNYPNTTVYNDAGAGMQVKYVADTKTYIDNKFSALSAAIVNNT